MQTQDGYDWPTPHPDPPPPLAAESLASARRLAAITAEIVKAEGRQLAVVPLIRQRPE